MMIEEGEMILLAAVSTRMSNVAPEKIKLAVEQQTAIRRNAARL